MTIVVLAKQVPDSGAERTLSEADRLRGADVLTTAKVLAAAVRTMEDVDLVLVGDATTDGQASAVPAVVADLLGLPQVTHVRKLDADAGRVRAERETEDGEVTLDAPLSALVSVAENPDTDVAGFLVTRTRVMEAVPRPVRTAGTRVTDDGSGGRQLAAYLIAQKLV
ncbi:hypothetical protein AB0I77_22695 [Streptomyces sp. NPDC050619]|uniref:electron transfer flavoprotein subunit beta/FixA family protein n=1 Tax=Streptomyces sp. NPDC050619 TaxID=3157214 RepID=UPI003441A187